MAGGGDRLNLAAYGYVRRDGGSVATAGYLILERLLDLGHAVEFHAIGGFIVPDGLIGRPGFTYRPTTLPRVRSGWRLVEALPGRAQAGATLAYSLAANAAHERVIGRAVALRHVGRPFDALLVLGLLPPFRVAGLPCVAWPQGAPNGEWEALRSLRPLAVRHGGAAVYAALRILYAWKRRQARRGVRRADRLIAGSRWSVENWVRLGMPRERCRALPYPVDLEMFRPDGPTDAARDESVTTFLWLGRVVPRKRLDLLLDAFGRLRRSRGDVRLVVVGRFTYPRGMRSLIAGLGAADGFEYRESVPRDEVPALLRRVDVLVQPSENEDVGSSALEALACGAPSVIGPTNGTRDHLGESAFLFDAYTPESLAAAMARAADSVRGRREEVAAAARATAERTFSVAGVAAGVEAALRAARSDRDGR